MNDEICKYCRWSGYPMMECRCLYCSEANIEYLKDVEKKKESEEL